MSPTRGLPRRARSSLACFAVAALLAGATAACTTTEYHGYDSGIDGWFCDRIALHKDPLSQSIYGPLDATIAIKHRLAPDLYPPAVSDPTEYLAGVVGTRWDGSVRSIPDLGLADGGAILYDVATTPSFASFSVFITSGARPGGVGREHPGPSEVYTCYSVEVAFGGASEPQAARTALAECPSPLVDELAEDAAFASVEVFDG